MIKNIIFDIGNVLVTFDWEDLAREIGFTDDDIQILVERVIGDRWDEFDRGVMPEDEALKYIQEVLPGLEDKFATLWYRIDEAIAVYPYVYGWMKDLKEEGYNIYLLSNFPKSLFEKESKEKLTFLKFVDGKVISSFVKLIKPNREIYEYLLNQYNLKADECVFLDDRAKNIIAAEAIGIHGIQFKNYEDARARLETLLSETGNKR